MVAKQSRKHLGSPHSPQVQRAMAGRKAGWGEAGSKHPGQGNRSANQARCSTMEVSRLLPLAGTCGAIVVVCASLLVMKLLQNASGVKILQAAHRKHL